MYISKMSVFDAVEGHDDALAVRALEEIYEYLEETWVEECEYDPVAEDIRDSEHLEEYSRSVSPKDDEIEKDPEAVALQEDWENLSREFTFALIPSAKLILELGEDKLPNLIRRSCHFARKALGAFDNQN